MSLKVNLDIEVISVEGKAVSLGVRLYADEAPDGHMETIARRLPDMVEGDMSSISLIIRAVEPDDEMQE